MSKFNVGDRVILDDEDTSRATIREVGNYYYLDYDDGAEGTEKWWDDELTLAPAEVFEPGDKVTSASGRKYIILEASDTAVGRYFVYVVEESITDYRIVTKFTKGWK